LPAPERRDRPRSPEARQPVEPGEGVRHLLSGGQGRAPRRRAGRRPVRHHPRERGGPPAGLDLRPRVPDPLPDRVRLAGHDARAGGHPGHGHAGRGGAPPARGPGGGRRRRGRQDLEPGGRGRMTATSRRFARLPPFPQAGMKATRARLEAEGVDVIDLGAGGAGLAPPPAAVARLREVVGDPRYSGYAFQGGLPEFRQAVARWMRRRFGVELDPSREILPLLGSKDGIAHLPFAFVDPGDAAVLPDPGYTPYVGGVLLAGGDPHRVPLVPEHDFLIPLDVVPAGVADRTRILYLNYPNNPATAP